MSFVEKFSEHLGNQKSFQERYGISRPTFTKLHRLAVSEGLLLPRIKKKDLKKEKAILKKEKAQARLNRRLVKPSPVRETKPKTLKPKTLKSLETIEKKSIPSPEISNSNNEPTHEERITAAADRVKIILNRQSDIFGIKFAELINKITSPLEYKMLLNSEAEAKKNRTDAKRRALMFDVESGKYILMRDAEAVLAGICNIFILIFSSLKDTLNPFLDKDLVDEFKIFIDNELANLPNIAEKEFNKLKRRSNENS